jgi:hypothetical protein
MPPYNTQVPPPALFASGGPQSSFLVLNKEAVLASEYSQQVHLAPNPSSSTKGLRVVIDFSANPGNVEFYVCESDNDSAGSADYIEVPSGGDLTQGSLITGPNGALTRLVADLNPFAGQFAALFTKTPPSNGGITCTARFTRSN